MGTSKLNYICRNEKGQCLLELVIVAMALSFILSASVKIISMSDNKYRIMQKARNSAFDGRGTKTKKIKEVDSAYYAYF